MYSANENFRHCHGHEFRYVSPDIPSPISIVSKQSSNNEEQEQIRQTIEMFEVIIQANPQDTHSMEILKEAYMNSGNQPKAVEVGRKLAEAYVEMGQYSSALLEYEGILQMEPDNAEIMAALGDLGQKLHGMQAEEQARQSEGAKLALNEVMADGSSGDLIATERTKSKDGEQKPKVATVEKKAEECNDKLGKFLIQNRIVSEDIVTRALDAVREKNKDVSGQKLTLSLLEEIVTRGALDMDDVLGGILNRLKFAYIPLDCYDIDRQVVRMLPENITFGNLMVPFDLISRTLMIAVSNPFDSEGMKAVQQQMDYHIQWYLASPKVISKTISDSYRLKG